MAHLKRINIMPIVVFEVFLSKDHGYLFSSWSSSSLLAQGPFDSHLCCQWSINGRDPCVSIFCVGCVPAGDLADHWAERGHRQAGDMEAPGCVLVCCLWFHPWCHWGLVLTILWYYSWRPELLVTAVWVYKQKTWHIIKCISITSFVTLQVLADTSWFIFFSHRERILQRRQSICNVSSFLHGIMAYVGVKRKNNTLSTLK